jgi:hypothetical protein
LAEAEASAGETDAGLQRLDDALAELEHTEARCYEAEMHHIRAGILLKRDSADTAAACTREGVAGPLQAAWFWFKQTIRSLVKGGSASVSTTAQLRLSDNDFLGSPQPTPTSSQRNTFSGDDP